MANQLNKIPADLEPIATLQLGNKALSVTVSAVWYQFFVSLSAVLSNLIGGVLGFSSKTGLIATGGTQATALALATEWAEITTTPAGSGVLLRGFGAGVPSTVFNVGGNTLKVYPPVGGQIDALGVNAPYGLVNNKMQAFNQTSPSQWRSTQLG